MTKEKLDIQGDHIQIEYKAIPFPISEPFRSELIAAAFNPDSRDKIISQIIWNRGVKVRRSAFRV